MKDYDKYELVRGAIDLHIHGGPDVFPRVADVASIAREASEAGLRAVVIKNHLVSTARECHALGRFIPEIHIFGGVVLNRAVGGINPAAVRATLEMGGKIIWMPTVDGGGHVEAFGATGTFGKKGYSLKDAGAPPLSILENDELSNSAEEILHIVKEYDAAIGTAHLRKDEIRVLVRRAKSLGVKILLTHPEFKVPNLKFNDLQSLVGDGVYAEICAVNVFPPALTTVEEQAALIKKIGAENCVIASDAGIPWGPMPHVMLSCFAQQLSMQDGISEMDMQRMMITNPEKILNLE